MTTRTLTATSLAIAFGLATVGVTACSSSNTATTGTSVAASPTTQSGSAGTMTDKTAVPKQDIVSTAAAAGQFTTLATALGAAGLVETLQGAGPYTVFAPTDEAFAKLPAGTVETLLKPENKEKLKTILTYHVVKGNVPASEVVKLDGKTVETVAGQTLTVKVNGNNVSLIDATGNTVAVIKTDVTASNGVIHVVDGVLMPKS